VNGVTGPRSISSAVTWDDKPPPMKGSTMTKTAHHRPQNKNLSKHGPPGTKINPPGVASKSHNIKMGEADHARFGSLNSEQRGRLIAKALELGL
jgi:hypothetical protein